jgi:hypothetical protein
MLSGMEKISCYIDETGQDTFGAFFLVAAVVLRGSVNGFEANLRNCERLSLKKLRKWSHTEDEIKRSYLRLARAQCVVSQVVVWYVVFTEGKDYVYRTQAFVGRVLRASAANENLPPLRIVVDGLNDLERRRMRVMLSRSGFRSPDVRGERDEGSAILRLADAMAGCVRDERDGKRYALEALRIYRAMGMIREI